MKRITYIILCVCLSFLSTSNIFAQVTCKSDWTFTIATQESTCQANGVITVTMGGDMENITGMQYGASSTDGGHTVEPQPNNVIGNLPPGTYTVTVRAFCAVDNNYTIVKEQADVVVPGTYQVTVATFNANSSRKSYATCATGVIVLNVVNGSGNYTFTIASAPDNSLLGEVTPVKSGASTYTLPGENYPAGTYTIMVEDGCYSAACNFTLGEISGFPSIASSGSAFYPNLTDNACDYVRWNPGPVNSSTQPDYYRYFADGMYEIVALPADQTPDTSTTWTVWTSGQRNMYVTPYNVSDVAGTSNRIRIHTRVKGCPETSTYTSASFSSYRLRSISPTRFCENYRITVYPWTDWEGLLCYPLDFRVWERATGIDILNETGISNTASRNVMLEYGKTYDITVTDSNGKVLSTSVGYSRSYFSFSYTDDFCNDQYRVSYSSTEPCNPTEVTIKDSEGNIICTNTPTSTSSNGSCYLEYGKSYSFEAVYKGTDPERTYSTIISRTTFIPTAYTIALYTTNSCIEDRGRLYIYRNNGSNPVSGTTYTVTGPEGYTIQSGNISASSSNTYLSETNLPAGTYTVTIINGCGDQTPITASITLNGVYSGRQLGYTTENTCEGLKVTPTGYITYQGNNQTSGTFYRLTNGPAGYDKTVKKTGESFVFSDVGTYTLGITTSNSTTACAINSITIEYTAQPLQLSTNETNAYVCVGSETGAMSMKAINGIPPYTYELWDATNTTHIKTYNSEEYPGVDSDRAVFEHGMASQDFTIRVADACGNSFSQQLTLTNLETARIVYTPRDKVCEGGNVELNCITLGETAYTWTGPNGFTSNDQNFVIPNAKPEMTGTYTVSVTPEFCGIPVVESIYIRVRTCYMPVNPNIHIMR